MNARSLRAWILDFYPAPEGMVLWLKDEDGRALRAVDSLPMSFFIAADPPVLRAVWKEISGWKKGLRLGRECRFEIHRGEEIDLLAVTAPGPLPYRAAVRTALARWPDLAFYNADLDPALVYGIERNVFPLAECRFSLEGARVRAVETDQTRWDLAAEPPPFRVLTLRLTGELRDPSHGYRAPLEIAAPGIATRECAWDSPRELVEAVRDALRTADPDILLTAWGDSFLLPELLKLAREQSIDLPLNRDARRDVLRKGERSYFSYGRIVHRPSSVWLFGRLHIDRQTAFLADEYGLDGLVELARTTGQPLQQVARTSSGTGISSMQVNEAYRRGWLIPYRKRQPEDFKTALELVRGDKGGLTFQPEPGLYEHVLELDFASMYPSLMVKYNLSAETVGRTCPKCANLTPSPRPSVASGHPSPPSLKGRGRGGGGVGVRSEPAAGGKTEAEAGATPGLTAPAEEPAPSPAIIPEIGYPVCQCRKGIVPLTLAPLLEKRLALKRAARALPEGPEREVLRRRQVALKWLLVTCFGYLGYKNARFGRIEAHESTTACGRDTLLRAKEIAEERGYRFLHALTDALWIYKEGSTDADHQALVEEIGRETGVRIDIEGLYRWLAFPPSRQYAANPVANRYFGAFEDGKIKMRGIEARRHDTIRWIREAQGEMLEILARAESAAQYRAKLAEVFALAREKLAALRRGDVPPRQLSILHRISQPPEEYRANLPVALAARELAAHGVHLAPGEAVEFVLTLGGGARPYDVWRATDRVDTARYRELFLRMLESLAVPAGYDRAAIVAELDGIRQDTLPGMAGVNIRGLISAVKDRRGTSSSYGLGGMSSPHGLGGDRLGLELR
jgi:DNA polymerase elongation subunit (family B)